MLNANYLALMMSPTFGLSEIRNTHMGIWMWSRARRE